MPYEVLIDDSYDYMDESKRYALDVYKSYEDAVVAAEGIVDEHLIAAYKLGMSFDDLYGGYRGWGEDPFIRAIPPHSNVEPFFSARGYAQKRCREICESGTAIRKKPIDTVRKGQPWWQFWKVND